MVFGTSKGPKVLYYTREYSDPLGKFMGCRVQCLG